MFVASVFSLSFDLNGLHFQLAVGYGQSAGLPDFVLGAFRLIEFLLPAAALPSCVVVVCSSFQVLWVSNGHSWSDIVRILRTPSRSAENRTAGALGTCQLPVEKSRLGVTYATIAFISTLFSRRKRLQKTLFQMSSAALLTDKSENGKRAKDARKMSNDVLAYGYFRGSFALLEDRKRNIRLVVRKHSGVQ